MMNNALCNIIYLAVGLFVAVILCLHVLKIIIYFKIYYCPADNIYHEELSLPVIPD